MPKGHRSGVYGKRLLGYFEARMKIYLPSYLWVLENLPEVKEIVYRIAERAKVNDIVFLYYNTNIDFRDTSSPLSHAGLVKLNIEGKYPKEGEEYTPLTAVEIEVRKASKKIPQIFLDRYDSMEDEERKDVFKILLRRGLVEKDGDEKG